MKGRARYQKHGNQLEDFWGRRRNAPRHRLEVELFGRRLEIASNDERPLRAVEQVRPLFSTATPGGRMSGRVQIVVDAGAGIPVPDDLAQRMRYVGHGDWALVQADRWGSGWIDLAAAEARMVVDDALADRSDLLGACLLNTIFLNLFIGSGMGMLHASALLSGTRLLLLVAPHAAGKSTTALRLVRAGYRLFTDSMVFLEMRAGELLLHGFPVGRARLRGDMVPHFPEFATVLEEEQVRGEIKYGVDLRTRTPEAVETQSQLPGELIICLLERSGGKWSRVEKVSRREVDHALFFNSLYYDVEEVWRRNLERIDRLVDGARLYRLDIGAQAEHIVETVDSLWGGC